MTITTNVLSPGTSFQLLWRFSCAHKKVSPKDYSSHRFLNDCIISKCQSGLVGADALTTLILSYNMLTEMPSRAFSSAPNLTKIDISHNEIASMASVVFKTKTDSITTDNESAPHALSHLEIIVLNHNKWNFIDSDWFAGLVRLTTLILNDNFLTEITACAAFITNTALRSLQLQNNQFSVIQTNGLSDNQCLNHLDSFDI